jgi:hypothetical protein
MEYMLIIARYPCSAEFYYSKIQQALLQLLMHDHNKYISNLYLDNPKIDISAYHYQLCTEILCFHDNASGLLQ